MLTLVNVHLVGCSQQAIVLDGPAAKLIASDCTFSSHGGGNTQTHGIVISAREATVQLSNMLIIGNQGHQQQTKDWAPTFHPACNQSSSGVSGAAKPGAPACASPILRSSLLHLQESSLSLSSVRISNNTADAVIVAEGSGAHSVQAAHDCRLERNNATWLLVADSFGYDTIGRKNLAESSVSIPGGPFSTYDFVGSVRGLTLAQLKGVAQLLDVERFVGKAPHAQVRRARLKQWWCGLGRVGHCNCRNPYGALRCPLEQPGSNPN